MSSVDRVEKSVSRTLLLPVWYSLSYIDFLFWVWERLLDSPSIICMMLRYLFWRTLEVASSSNCHVLWCLNVVCSVFCTLILYGCLTLWHDNELLKSVRILPSAYYLFIERVLF